MEPPQTLYAFRNALRDVAQELEDNCKRKTDQKLANLLKCLGYALDNTRNLEAYTERHKVRQSIRDALAEFWKKGY